MTISDLPSLLIEDIKKHLISSSNEVEENFETCWEDEDALTGALLASIQTKEWQSNSGWKWKITANFLRGRGPNAIQSKTGADGIISLNINSGNAHIQTKSIIFQAKKKGNGTSLKTQIENMNSILPYGNMVIIYSKNGYFGQTGKDYDKAKNNIKFGNYLSDIFLGCYNGQWGVYYDRELKRIIFDDDKNSINSIIEYHPSYKVDIDVVKDK